MKLLSFTIGVLGTSVFVVGAGVVACSSSSTPDAQQDAGTQAGDTGAPESTGDASTAPACTPAGGQCTFDPNHLWVGPTRVNGLPTSARNVSTSSSCCGAYARYAEQGLTPPIEANVPSSSRLCSENGRCCVGGNEFCQSDNDCCPSPFGDNGTCTDLSGTGNKQCCLGSRAILYVRLDGGTVDVSPLGICCNGGSHSGSPGDEPGVTYCD